MANLRVCSNDDYERVRNACTEDPGGVWGAVAAADLHWSHESGSWLARAPGEEQSWRGWSALAEPVELTTPWQPWRDSIDAHKAPHVRWFVGGRINAAFNEVDRHVLRGGSAEIAFTRGIAKLSECSARSQ